MSGVAKSIGPPADEMEKPDPFILAVGGGKGGTGKSSIALNLAAALGSHGKGVVLVDMDFGGANLHTMMGIRSQEKRLIDYLYHSRGTSDLNPYCLETPVPMVKLVSGDGFRPGIANMEFGRKTKLLRGLRRVDADMVICDLGAGCSYNVIDFFCGADQGIVVMTLEATGVLNGYEFLKNCVFRLLLRRFSKQRDVVERIRRYRDKLGGVSGDIPDLIAEVEKTHPECGEVMRDLCRSFRPALLFNMSRGSRSFLNGELTRLGRKHLGIDTGCWGVLPREEAAAEAGNKRMPFVLSYPESSCSREIRRIVVDHLIPQLQGVN